jgi:hypothetical protein
MTPPPFAHTVAPVDDEGWAKPPQHASLPIKPHPPSSCVRLHVAIAHHCRRPVRTVLRSCPWPTDISNILPSPHLSSHTHVWPSSTPHLAGIWAEAAVPPLSRHRPSSEAVPTDPTSATNRAQVSTCGASCHLLVRFDRLSPPASSPYTGGAPLRGLISL